MVIADKISKPKFISRKKRKELEAIRQDLARSEQPLPIARARPVDPQPHQELSEIQDPEIPEMEYPLQESSPHSTKLGTWSKPLGQMDSRDWRIVAADLGLTYSEPNQQPLRSWADRSLKSKFREPTPIQAAAIPLLLDGRNVIGVAPTGSGKTLAFCLPAPQGPLSSLILSPTRELAIQTSTLLSEIGLKNACLVGGRDFESQERDLANSSAIVATPGRLIDFMAQKLISLDTVVYFVCDEADRMLDLGFGPQLDEITAALHNPQTALFTATWDSSIDELAQRVVQSPITIRIDTKINTDISQEFEWVKSEMKQHRAIQVAKELPKPCIIFCNTRAVCDALESVIPSSVAIHSSRSQQAREHSLKEFKMGLDVLIATDVIGRGIDITGVASVLNYDMPTQVDTYVHRIGRTGRAGRKGRALTLAEKTDLPILEQLRKLMRDANYTSTDRSSKSLARLLTEVA